MATIRRASRQLVWNYRLFKVTQITRHKSPMARLTAIQATVNNKKESK